MNEADARSVILVRAYETLPASHAGGLWTEADRDWATQASLQAEGENAAAAAFIASRARLAGERLCARDQGVRRALSALSWRPWIGWALALIALIAGVATDAIGPAHRINVLAPPLLALLAWNFAVYAVIFARAAAPSAAGGSRHLGPLARQVARAVQALAAFGKERNCSAPLAAFARDWTAACVPLTAVRIARTLHAAAACFALGALFGMYMRGLVLDYRAGWESTFLDASAVHALLSVVLGPAAALSGIALPDETALAAIRSTVSDGESAARWIHLYALTVALFVLLPRASMALGHWLVERRLAGGFPLPLDDAYFQALARARRGEAAEVRVVPYSYRPGAKATLGLNALLARVLGARTEVLVAPTVPFGGEDALDAAPMPGASVALVAALFPLTATPERENHGVFVDALAARLPQSTPFAVLVDESAFRERFGEEEGAGAERGRERRAAWVRMLAASGREPVFVDLERPGSADAERVLRAALVRAPGRRAQD